MNEVRGELGPMLRYESEKVRHWTARRDALICAAHADGASLRAIAEQVGLTHPTIARIVRDGVKS